MQAAEKRQLELQWSEKMKMKQAKEADEKKELALKEQHNRLVALEKLKEQDGPFTDAEQVEVYLSLRGIDEKERRKRLKLEIQYDRDTSTLLPKFILFSKLKKKISKWKAK